MHEKDRFKNYFLGLVRINGCASQIFKDLLLNGLGFLCVFALKFFSFSPAKPPSRKEDAKGRKRVPENHGEPRPRVGGKDIGVGARPKGCCGLVRPSGVSARLYSAIVFAAR